MRVPAGSPIISLSTPAPLAALSRLRNLQFAVFLAGALFPSSPRTTPSRHPSTLSWVSPLLPSLAEVASPSRGLAALGDTVFASRTPGWHSPRVAAPLSSPTHRAPASLPRSLCALEWFDAAVSSPRSSEDVVRLCPRFTQCGQTQVCPHCPSSSTTLTLYRGSQPDAYLEAIGVAFYCQDCGTQTQIMWKTAARLQPPRGEYSDGYDHWRGFCAPQWLEFSTTMFLRAKVRK